MIHVIEFFYPNGGPHFALLDTVRDQFIMYNGVHMWESFNDWQTDFCYDTKLNNVEVRSHIERIRGLMDQWFLDR